MLSVAAGPCWVTLSPPLALTPSLLPLGSALARVPGRQTAIPSLHVPRPARGFAADAILRIRILALLADAVARAADADLLGDERAADQHDGDEEEGGTTHDVIVTSIAS